MDERERQAYKKGQYDMAKAIFGFIAIALTIAIMLGQIFLY